MPGGRIIRANGRAGVATSGRAAIRSTGTCGCCGGVAGLLCTGCGSSNQLSQRCRLTFSGITHRNTGCECGSWANEWLFNINTSYLLTRLNTDSSVCEFGLASGIPALQQRRCTTGVVDATYLLGLNALFIRNPGSPATYSVAIRMDLTQFGQLFGANAGPYMDCVLNHQPFHESQEDGPPPNPPCTLWERHTSAVVTVSFE